LSHLCDVATSQWLEGLLIDHQQFLLGLNDSTSRKTHFAAGKMDKMEHLQSCLLQYWRLSQITSPTASHPALTGVNGSRNVARWQMTPVGWSMQCTVHQKQREAV
jgi:hypothetical protein